MAKIEFTNQKLIVEAKEGAELTQLYDQNPDIPLKFGCRRGRCGVCAVEVVEGAENLTKISSQEIETLEKKGLTGNHRLACQCALNGPVSIGT